MCMENEPPRNLCKVFTIDKWKSRLSRKNSLVLCPSDEAHRKEQKSYTKLNLVTDTLEEQQQETLITQKERGRARPDKAVQAAPVRGTEDGFQLFFVAFNQKARIGAVSFKIFITPSHTNLMSTPCLILIFTANHA